MKKLNGRWACVLAAGLVWGGAAMGQPDPTTAPPATKRPQRGLPAKPVQPAEAPAAPATPDAPATQPAAPAAPAAPQAPSVPAAPAAPATKSKDAPKVGPYVKQISPKDLTLAVDVRIHLDNATQKSTYRDPFNGTTVDMPSVTPMTFNTMGFIFPLVPSTGSMDLFTDEYKGVLRINGLVVQENHRVKVGYPAGTKLAAWEAGSMDSTTEARQVELHVEAPMRCYNTQFDEAAAMAVTWPTMAWPAEAASALAPQLYVEAGVDNTGAVRAYDDRPVKQAMKELFEDKGMKDLTRIPPVRVAKLITAKVWETVQISGEGMVFMRTGEFAGMDLQSPAQTLENKKGSEMDATVLLTAMLRRAGLPARTVIGFDVNGKENKFLQKGNKNNKLRSWVEFALFDEAKNTINWVPIDLAKLRKSSNRPMPLERTWAYFGSNDELNGVPVVALHFHPPTDVVAYGAPAFWGWFVTPAPAKNAEQAVRFMATPTSKKGGEPTPDPKNPANKTEKKPAKRGY